MSAGFPIFGKHLTHRFASVQRCLFVVHVLSWLTSAGAIESHGQKLFLWEDRKSLHVRSCQFCSAYLVICMHVLPSVATMLHCVCPSVISKIMLRDSCSCLYIMGWGADISGCWAGVAHGTSKQNNSSLWRVAMMVFSSMELE